MIIQILLRLNNLFGGEIKYTRWQSTSANPLNTPERSFIIKTSGLSLMQSVSERLDLIQALKIR
jgi:hypothetical protein